MIRLATSGHRVNDDPGALRVGLIGLGSIGAAIARYLVEGRATGVSICGALVRDVSRTRRAGTIATYTSLDELLARSPDIVVEAAGRDAVRAFGPPVLAAGYDLLLTSVGALGDSPTLEKMLAAAKIGRSRLEYVSGSIGGLDAIAAAAVGGLDAVTITTSKPARTLLPPADAESLTGPREIFAGTARRAAELYPESLNVAAALSLAGVGFDKTRVRVIADASIMTNQHVITASGAFGTLTFSIHGQPSEDNPRTARLVAMSVVHALASRRRARSRDRA